MDATNVEISGNNSNIDSEELVSYIIMVFQFLPIVIVAFLALFNNRDLKGEIFENLAIITCIDAATAITTIYDKHSSNKLTLILINCLISVVGLFFYMMLVLNAVKVWPGVFNIIIIIGTLFYIYYKVHCIIKG